MKTEKEKMLQGELYDPSDATLVQDRINARLLFRKYNNTPESEIKVRTALIKQIFGTTGNKIHVESNLKVDYGYNIHVGENFYSNYDLTILDVARVTIGDNCMFAPGVHIYTATHPTNPVARNSGKEFALPVTIGHNCWIGGRAIINPGIAIGNNVVIASGAVVTKDVPDNVVVAGVPAKIIQTIK